MCVQVQPQRRLHVCTHTHTHTHANRPPDPPGTCRAWASIRKHARTHTHTHLLSCRIAQREPRHMVRCVLTHAQVLHDMCIRGQQPQLVHSLACEPVELSVHKRSLDTWSDTHGLHSICIRPTRTRTANIHDRSPNAIHDHTQTKRHNAMNGRQACPMEHNVQGTEHARGEQSKTQGHGRTVCALPTHTFVQGTLVSHRLCRSHNHRPSPSRYKRNTLKISHTLILVHTDKERDHNTHNRKTI